MHGLPCRLVVLLALAAAFTACGRPRAPAPAPGPQWLGTWAASPQLVEPRNMPPAPGLEGSTLRQVIHISVGGPTVRVRFSNTFGTTPLAITSAHIARSRGRSAIDLTSDRPLTFAGADSVRIAPGAMAISDRLEYDVPALSDLAVTMQIGAAPADVTGHPGSRTTSFLQAGQWISSAELPDADRKSTRLNSSHPSNSYAVFCLKKKKRLRGRLIDQVKLVRDKCQSCKLPRH